MEAAVHDLGVQSDGLEDLRALVGRQRADAHLGHDLEDAQADGLDVLADDAFFAVVAVDEALVAAPEQGLEGQVRVDRVGAESHEGAEVVDLARLAGLDDDAHAGAFFLADQVVVYGPGGHQGRERDAVECGGPIAEDDELVALGDGKRGLLADAVQRGDHGLARGLAFPRGVAVARLALGPGVRDIDDLGLLLGLADRAVVGVLDGGELFVVEDRLVEVQSVAVGGFALEQVALGANEGLQRHDDLFAQRVDGRVGDLGEELLEVVVEQSGLVAEHGQRGVVAHRACGLLALLDHGQHEHVDVLGGVAEGPEQGDQFGGLDAVAFVGGGHGQVADVDAVLFEPLAVGPGVDDLVLEFLVRDDAALLEVDEEHPARFEPALEADLLGGDVNDADLAGHDDAVVLGDVVTAGPQAVAVQRRADALAVGEGDRRGAVPGFLLGGAEGVEVALGLGHVVVVLPGLGDHGHDGLGEASAGAHEQLEDGVERPRVREVFLDDGEQGREIGLRAGGESVAVHDALTGEEPVAVAAQGVELAVVAHVAAGLGAVPARERVGAEAGVDHGEVRLVVGVAQVGVVGGDLEAGELALVDDHAGVERADVEVAQLVGEVAGLAGLLGQGLDLVRGAFAGEVEAAGEFEFVEARGGVIPEGVTARRGEEELFDVRLGEPGRGAHVGAVGIGGQFAPAQQHEAEAGDLLFDDALAAFALLGFAGQEDVARGVSARLGEFDVAAVLGQHAAPDRAVGGDLAEELVGQAGHDARAVAGVGLTATGAAVIHAAEHGEGVGDDLVGAFALDVGDEPHAAGVVLVGGVVQAPGRGQPRGEDVGGGGLA